MRAHELRHHHRHPALAGPPGPGPRRDHRDGRHAGAGRQGQRLRRRQRPAGRRGPAARRRLRRGGHRPRGAGRPGRRGRARRAGARAADPARRGGGRRLAGPGRAPGRRAGHPHRRQPGVGRGHRGARVTGDTAPGGPRGPDLDAPVRHDRGRGGRRDHHARAAHRLRGHPPRGPGPAPADRHPRGAADRVDGDAHLGRLRPAAGRRSGRPGSTRSSPGACCGRTSWPTWPGCPTPGALWVSHLDDRECTQVREALPDIPIRLRLGTRLWLGDRAALRAGGTVLAVHATPQGQSAGYHQRRGPRDGLRGRDRRRDLARRRAHRTAPGPQRPPAGGRRRVRGAGGGGSVPLPVPAARRAVRRGSSSRRTCTSRCCGSPRARSPRRSGELLECDVRFTTVAPDAIIG